MRAFLSLFFVLVFMGNGFTQDETWENRAVIPKKGSPSLSLRDRFGRNVIVGKIDIWPVPVKEESGDLIRVQVRNTIGWVSKDQVVRIKDGVTYFTKRIEEKDDVADALSRRAAVWAAMENADKALKDADEALAMNKDAMAFNIRGWAWDAKKEYAKAIKDYTSAIEIDPGMEIAYFNRANSRMAKDEWDMAIKDFTRAIELDPRNMENYLYRGNAWLAKKNFEKSLADYSTVIELNPKNAIAYFNRGNALDAKGDFTRSITEYSRAIALDPKFFDAFVFRGRAYVNKNDFDRGIYDYNQAISLDGTNPRPFADKAFAYYLKKDYEQASKEYTKALELDADDLTSLNGLAWLLSTCPEARYRDGKKAVSLAKKTLEIKPGSPFYSDTMAAALAENGQFDEAVKFQKEALDSPEFDAQFGDEAKARLFLYLKKKPFRK